MRRRTRSRPEPFPDLPGLRPVFQGSRCSKLPDCAELGHSSAPALPPTSGPTSATPLGECELSVTLGATDLPLVPSCVNSESLQVVARSRARPTGAGLGECRVLRGGGVGRASSSSSLKPFLWPRVLRGSSRRSGGARPPVKAEQSTEAPAPRELFPGCIFTNIYYLKFICSFLVLLLLCFVILGCDLLRSTPFGSFAW